MGDSLLNSAWDNLITLLKDYSEYISVGCEDEFEEAFFLHLGVLVMITHQYISLWGKTGYQTLEFPNQCKNEISDDREGTKSMISNKCALLPHDAIPRSVALTYAYVLSKQYTRSATPYANSFCRIHTGKSKPKKQDLLFLAECRTDTVPVIMRKLDLLIE
jgi:hypothetical protein